MNEHLTVAIRAARLAGDFLRQNFGKPLHIDFKGPINPVTEVDRQAQTLIINTLQKAFPTYGVLSEEGLDNLVSGQPRWIIDPLDGTTNYAHGYRLFAVSIALEVSGEVELGVVYNPLADELFVAERGKGARLNHRPIHVSNCSELGKAVVASGFPYDMWDNPADNLAEWGRIVKRVLSVRCDGSATLDLCHVAAGRLDAFWELDLDPWDLAAGVLIIREAGGVVTDLNGAPFRLPQRSFLASNGLLHQDLLKVITNANNRVSSSHISLNEISRERD